MNCHFPYCKQNAKSGSIYCIGHGRMMKGERLPGDDKEEPEDKPAVAPKIEPVADKRKQELKEYNKKRKVFLTKHYKCQVRGCNNASTEVHHKSGRENDMLLKEEHWMAVCHTHHRAITDNSEWAYKEGYSLSRLEKSA